MSDKTTMRDRIDKSDPRKLGFLNTPQNYVSDTPKGAAEE
jgi:hypothetical protein